MALLDEIRGMQQQGLSEDQIIQTLRQRGLKYKEIADALAQTKIKSAVEGPPLDAPTPGQNTQGMEMSIMNQQSPAPTPGQNYQQQYYEPQQQYAPQQEQYYPQYEQQATAPAQSSAEMITEVAEQVAAEKIGELRKHLDKIIDLKSTLESRMQYLDERLKRIEKIIDTLQSSVLRKVGDYVNDIQDIKKELGATQKTFSQLLPELKKNS